MCLEGRYITINMNPNLTIQQIKRQDAQKEILKKAGAYLLLAVGAISMIGPFLWMVSTSFKAPGQVFSFQKNW